MKKILRNTAEMLLLAWYAIGRYKAGAVIEIVVVPIFAPIWLTWAFIENSSLENYVNCAEQDYNALKFERAMRKEIEK